MSFAVQDHSSRIQALYTGREWVESTLGEEGDVGVALESTSFYAEAGGQVKQAPETPFKPLFDLA
jgi:alanyl-tRNA synthetase